MVVVVSVVVLVEIVFEIHPLPWNMSSATQQA